LLLEGSYQAEQRQGRGELMGRLVVDLTSLGKNLFRLKGQQLCRDEKPPSCN
jgi:hypothetical protein